MLDKNGVKIKKGSVVNFDNQECKVWWAKGNKLILSRPGKPEPYHVRAESLRDKIVNIEVINV